MKSRIVFLLLCFSLSSVIQAHSETILPDSCGSDGVTFKVKTKPGQLPPDAPEAGKAQIIFIENLDTAGGLFFTTPTTRFGVDGAWVGANRDSSYFVTSVDPGEHHLCVNWQSGTDNESKKVGMAKFTAEAGKVYYFEVLITRKRSGGGFVAPASGPGVINGGGGMVGGTRLDISFSFSLVDEDEGKYRVKASPLSTSTVNK